MPIRAVSPRSDRGSIKDIQKAVNNALEENPNMPPTSQELRIRSLYEYASSLGDQVLIDSLGFIVMSGSPKDPVSIMRHRQYVHNLANKLGVKIEEAKNDIDSLIQEENAPIEMRIAAYKRKAARDIILTKYGETIKGASDMSFWRSK